MLKPNCSNKFGLIFIWQDFSLIYDTYPLYARPHVPLPGTVLTCLCREPQAAS